MADSNVEKIQARILKHMNTDHAESLSLYLRHYSQLSSQEAQGAIMYEVSVSSISLRTVDSKVHIIRLEPPLNSLADFRERMVEMDGVVRKALGVFKIRLKRYVPPTSILNVSIFSACFFIFSTFAMLKMGGVIVPGTLYYDKVLAWFPGGPEMSLRIVKKITLPLIGIHLAEAWYLDRTRLGKYGVERGTRLWWSWIISCLIEGFGCFQRIDAEVGTINLQTDKDKHSN